MGADRADTGSVIELVPDGPMLLGTLSLTALKELEVFEWSSWVLPVEDVVPELGSDAWLLLVRVINGDIWASSVFAVDKGTVKELGPVIALLPVSDDCVVV